MPGRLLFFQAQDLGSPDSVKLTVDRIGKRGSVSVAPCRTLGVQDLRVNVEPILGSVGSGGKN